MGLLLTGGGARAAYQIGVLKALATSLPRNREVPFKIICGTSAGAINATALACYASCFRLGVKKLEWVWKNFTTNQVYKCDGVSSFRYLLNNFFSSFQAEYANKRSTSLFNNAPLRALLTEILDLGRIDRNLVGGYLSALSINASCYNDGNSYSFYQSLENHDWRREKRIGIKSAVNMNHLMASSAIPLVFPSVRIQQNYYGDGSVHQLSPLSPAIHLGADKILIIGVEQPPGSKYYGLNPHPPDFATIAGHLLDTIFSDTLHSDIERLSRVNQTLSLLPDDKSPPLKKIDHFLINPSHNFNQIACEYFHELPLAVKMLLKTIGIQENSESSLGSYLLFEKPYTQRLIQLGFEDGLEKLNALRDFLEIE